MLSVTYMLNVPPRIHIGVQEFQEVGLLTVLTVNKPVTVSIINTVPIPELVLCLVKSQE